MTMLSHLMQSALEIKNQKKTGGNTEALVGGLFESLVEQIEQLDEKMATLIIGWIWKDPVNTYADLKSIYPNPDEGWAAVVKTGVAGYPNGAVHVWDGRLWVNVGFAGFPIDMLTNRTIVQATGSDTTKIMSQKAVTDALAKKAGTQMASETLNGLMSQADKVKLNALVLSSFVTVQDDIWQVAFGYENKAGEKFVQLGIRHDGHIYPLHDLIDSRALNTFSDDLWALALTHNDGSIISGVRHDGSRYPLDDMQQQINELKQQINK